MWKKSCCPDEKNCQVHRRCYPGENKWKKAAGYVLIAAGFLVVILCVPLWAWWGILGLVLIGIGVFLTRG